MESHFSQIGNGQMKMKKMEKESRDMKKGQAEINPGINKCININGNKGANY